MYLCHERNAIIHYDDNTKPENTIRKGKESMICASVIIIQGSFMNFYSVRDLRTESKNVWDNLSAGGEVVITNNGKPSALMINIPEGGFDEIVQAVRQAKAMIAFNNMRSKAAMSGFMSEKEIEAEINAARNEE